jgi:hypothetical protein
MERRPTFTFELTVRFKSYLADVTTARVTATSRLHAIRQFCTTYGANYSIIAVSRTR